ncbi:membrane-targeted effector domain-containing toxin [Pseudomonas triticifolii]|uniref:Membrane-targeted effector domain-containing toxin n=1 Tax=Pseudomonas triticifolii TaxID=2762592 RepID=A0ABR7BKU3_9PSED|nr:membrane-targeted effector domain-containing toxin [Pseudomonas triticifolii]MBC3957804.1 membrane-targeted effector domain-containing toxin [Pseudomonas triticifolii]
MQTLTPVSLKPLDTFAQASAALKRLDELSSRLSDTLKQLPVPDDALLDAPASETHVTRLIAQLDDYWRPATTPGETRYDQCLSGLRQALRDEVTLKMHEGVLAPIYANCLPATVSQMNTSPTPDAFSLHVQLDDDVEAELAGALVLSQAQGPTLLVLPGLGLTAFATQAQMLEALALWLNSPALKTALTRSLEQRHQDQLAAIDADPDLYADPFLSIDVQLKAIDAEPLAHALDSLLTKQRSDVRHACALQGTGDRQKHRALIQHAIDQHGLFGPQAMLELREIALREADYRRSLPDWIKLASPKEMAIYTELLDRCEQARAAVLSTLGTAASPEAFALAHLKAHLADDLGYALDPGLITISTQRTLPVTGETYRVTHSWVELALYGLHPGDRAEGSEFLTRTTIDYDNVSLDPAYSALDAAYIARVVEEVDARVKFGDFQKAAYRQAHNQQLMRTLTHTQITALACAAKMQGHIRPEDLAIVEAVVQPAKAGAEAPPSVQQIMLDGHALMSKLLVFRKQSASGQLERLIMFAQDAPDQHHFHAFDNERQLMSKLVGWTKSQENQDYLLGQIEVSARPRLEKQLRALQLKPYPQDDFFRLIDVSDYQTALSLFALDHASVTISEQARQTPFWYAGASLANRQQLIALEEAAAGALRNYQLKPHTHVKPFEEYVFERASQQINTLLGLPDGTVDPDLIVIKSERETVTYTDMLLNGYDDSIDPTRATADRVATFKGPEGVDLSALSPQKVAGSIRGKWLADDYIALVRGTLLNPDNEGYEYRRTASVAINQLHMKAAALRSVLKGHIDGTQYDWLMSSLDRAHLNDAQTRQQYPFYPLQLHIDKPFIASGLKGVDQLVIPDQQLIHVETVQGCLAVLPTQIRQSALLYTPLAPDGVEFRLFSDFIPSLSKAGMIDYYKDRCRLMSRRTLAFFLRDMQQGGANKAPFLPKEYIADFADTCFNTLIERKLRDTEETTTGRHDMLSRMIWISAELIVTALTLPFPPASFAVGSLLSLHDTVRAVQALTEGDQNTASGYILSSLFNGLGAAGDLLSGLKGFGGIVHRLEKRLPEASALPPIAPHDLPPRYEDLFPANLQDKAVLVGKTNANGHAPLFQQVSPSSQKISATGQFASRTPDGNWQPLSSPLDTANTAGRDLAVDLSLQNVPRIKNGHANGICSVQGKHYINLSGKTYQVQFDAQMRYWQIIDPANPFAFFGKQPVRLNKRGQWEKIGRHQLRGGGLGDEGTYRPLPDEAATAVNTSVRLSDYEMPPEMRPWLYAILDKNIPDPTEMGLELYFKSYYDELRQVFSRLQDKLYQDAKAFFMKVVVPARPPLPTLAPDAGVDSLFESVFTHSNGLVLSEATQSVASKRLLILNMPLLKQQNVEVLYLEHLFTDKHLEKLATYRQLGGKSRSGSHEIKNHLKHLNKGALRNQTSEYDYYHLIKAAHRHGIEVRPFSSSTSYPLQDHAVAAAAGDLTAAQKTSNFFGHHVISADVASQPSKRWIALLDEKLATTHDTIPGIAELQGAISVHVQDVPTGRATRVLTTGTTPSPAGLSTDFTIELSNPLIAAPKPVAPPSTRVDEILMNRMADRETLESGERWAGDYVFRWEAESGWVRSEQQGSTGPRPLTAIQQSLSDATYEVPLEQRSALHTLASFEHRGLDERFFYFDPDLSEVREAFFRLRGQLQQDAHAVESMVLPARPLLPDLAPKTSPQELLEKLYQHTDGIVLGETHSSIASKKLIIDNLPALAQQNVKTLYLEHLLSDLHQADLDHFLETGEMTKHLLHELQALDIGHRTDPAGVYNFEQLVIKARQHGLEIRAIDCLASYHLKGLPGETVTTRQQMMNYFASRTIRKHQEVMGSHKWIALVGNSHSNTFKNAVPGIAELEGGIGLRVIDGVPGQSRGVVRDPGESLPLDMGKLRIHIQGDYRVDLEVPRPDVTVPRSQSIGRRLAKPGMFLIEQTDDGLHVIVHRSRDGQIHRTPVHVDANGKLSVDRPSWKPLHLKTYEDMNALTIALRDMNLSRVE